MVRIDWKGLDDFERHNAERICRHFFPLGKKEGQEWKLGDVGGDAGKKGSLGIQLTGTKAGLWHDRATGEKGKLRNLIAKNRNIPDEAAVDEIERAFGVSFREQGNNQNGSFDWMTCVMAMAADHKTLHELETWRGLSTQFCSWLVAHKLLGLYKAAIAFPIFDQAGHVTSPHYLLDRENKVWRYFTGTTVSALVIGNPKSANEFHVHESTWDALTFADRTQAYLSPEVCTIVTRGAHHTKTVHGLIPGGKRVYVWPQNDKPKADGTIPSEQWLEGVKENLDGPFFRVQTPPEFEDLNDWTRGGATKADLVDAMVGAELVGEPPKVFIEFLLPSQIKAYQPPPGSLLVGDNHIIRGSVFILAGPPGVGKSRGTIALAEAGATMLDWFGLKVHVKFKTLIVQNENGRYRLKLEFADLNENLLDQYLRISPPPPYGLCFDKREFRDQLKAGIDDHQPGVILVDPWNAVARDDKAKDYRETFDLVRDVVPAGDEAPAIGIVAHTRKPIHNERANGRALLNLLSGSYVLASVPRSVWVLQHASDDVSESRVVVTCCKNNDGELGARSVWVRDNGLWTSVKDFDWEQWDNPDPALTKNKTISERSLAEVFENGDKALKLSEARDSLMTLTGKGRSVCYSALDEKGKFADRLFYDRKTKLMRWVP